MLSPTAIHLHHASHVVANLNHHERTAAQLFAAADARPFAGRRFRGSFCATLRVALPGRGGRVRLSERTLAGPGARITCTVCWETYAAPRRVVRVSVTPQLGSSRSSA